VNSERILGISFFNGTPAEAVDYFLDAGGLLVTPPSPALANLKYDVDYRRAMQSATIALPDSELLTKVWKSATGRSLKKISGTDYLKALLGNTRFRNAADTFWIVGSDSAKQRTLDLLGKAGLSIDLSNIYTVPDPILENDRYQLLNQIEQLRPANIVIAIPGGPQVKLGSYLQEYAMHRPNVHCIGAALDFLTGEQNPIPNWAEHFGVAWLVRLSSQPRMILPRLGIAAAVAAMIMRYKSEMPPLQKRWADI